MNVKFPRKRRRGSFRSTPAISRRRQGRRAEDRLRTRNIQKPRYRIRLERGDTSFVECLCPMEPNSVLPRLGHHMGAKADTERYFSGGSDG